MPPRSYLDVEELPQTIPVFPLAGVLLLPRSRLPLNLFEPRYLKMLDDALATPDRFIAMIQPRPGSAAEHPELLPVACAGRVTGFNETPDGRYLIALDGVARCKIVQELSTTTPYRIAQVDWTPYALDLKRPEGAFLEREKLMPLLRSYADQLGVEVQWEMLEAMEDEQLLNAVAMLSPFGELEKQALLEAADLAERASLVESFVQLALAGDTGDSDPTIQ